MVPRVPQELMVLRAPRVLTVQQAQREQMVPRVLLEIRVILDRLV